MLARPFKKIWEKKEHHNIYYLIILISKHLLKHKFPWNLRRQLDLEVLFSDIIAQIVKEWFNQFYFDLKQVGFFSLSLLNWWICCVFKVCLGVSNFNFEVTTSNIHRKCTGNDCYRKWLSEDTNSDLQTFYVLGFQVFNNFKFYYIKNTTLQRSQSSIVTN